MKKAILMDRKLIKVVVTCVFTIVLVVVGFFVFKLLSFYLDKDSRSKALFNKAEVFYKNDDIESALLIYDDILSKTENQDLLAKSSVKLAEIYLKKGLFQKARYYFKVVIDKHFSNSDSVEIAISKIGNLNMQLFFSNIEEPFKQKYVVTSGDTLARIANKFNTTIDFIMRINGLSMSTIYPKQTLLVPNGKFSIVVDKSENIMTLKFNDEVFKIYKISTGKNNCTPVGVFQIVDPRLKNPTWYKGAEVVAPNTPENILGTRWLAISKKGYGIHGTTSPETIGTQETSGCVRMTNPDVEEIFDVIPIGTEVTIIE